MSVVDEVKTRLDIIEFVSSYVPSLKKAGRTYKGLCPFHTEKTPSFVVFPDTQSWHCFGACGTGGDVFGFMMRREGYTFAEALKFLAQKTGVALAPQSPAETEVNKQYQKLLKIVAVASDYFHQQLLQAPQAEFVRNYIADRGLGQRVISQFQLGYAHNQWENLKTFLENKGYIEKDLISAGLVVAKEDGTPGYDRFRQRLIIPIRNVQGQVIGFGARALQDNQQPKYLNSPQNSLFDKSATLYALDVAKNAIRDKKQAVIVEGYMDVLQAHEQGYTNVIASMGTALTEQQLKQLKRYTNEFVLALDADKAGSAATLRGINVARETLTKDVVPVPTAQGLIRYEDRLNAEIKVASLPPGKDPDDVLKAGPDAWLTLITEALPLTDYYIKKITADLDLDTAKGKSAAVQQLIPLLQQLNNPIEQQHYLQQLATLVRIDERTLKAELQRLNNSKLDNTKSSTNNQPIPSKLPQSKTASARIGLEEQCLAMLIGQPSVLDQVNQALYKNEIGVLAVDDFLKTENKSLFLSIKKWAISDKATNFDVLQEMVDDYLDGHLATLTALWYQQPNAPIEYVSKAVPKIILRIRRLRLKTQIQELNLLLGDALKNKDELALLKCKTLISEAKTELNKLDKAYDALSIMGRRRIEEKYLV